MKKILNEGFIKLVDSMGSDQRILDAARVSTGSVLKGKTKDQALIIYLMKNKHESPFEKIVMEFHIKCPIFVARHWFRHRIGSFSEKSGRYQKLNFEYWMPENGVWRLQDKKNKQASHLPLTESSYEINDQVHKVYRKAFEVYESLLSKGIAREQARSVLPLGIYTEFYWTVNFRSLMNFLMLRLDKHAQEEIRVYARAILEILIDTNKIPWTIDAFSEHYLENDCEMDDETWKILS